MSQNGRKQVGSANLADVTRAYRLIREFRKMHPEITCQLAEAFLIIAMSDGTTVSEIGRRMGTTTATASRHVAHLGKWDRRREPGLGLVEMHETLSDRRVKEVRLNSKGRMVAESLAQIVGD